MTEAEWLASMNPEAVLAQRADPPGERRTRLLAAAICRRMKSLFLDPNSLRVVEIIEAFADGAATHDELRVAASAAVHDWEGFAPTNRLQHAQQYAAAAVAHAAGEVQPVTWALSSATMAAHYGGKTVKLVPAFAAIARDILGNPFRPTPVIDREWLTDTVVSLARGMYESREFDAMPILADALQDAGCDSEDVLRHCRDPHATHARGCWVVDAVLGKG